MEGSFFMGQYALRSRVQTLSLATLLLTITAIISPVASQELEGNALKRLALQGIWEAEHAEYGFWKWNTDGTVCLRVGNKDGKCTDTGSWYVADNVLCYELKWWGNTAGERKNCFTVQPLKDGRFETLFYGALMVSRMFAFKLSN